MAEKGRAEVGRIEMTEKMMNRLVVFLTCLCIALLLVIGYQHQQYAELVEQNHRMELQLKKMSSQVNEIWAEYMGVMKRLQQHG